jgi:hypothetical protein
VIGKDQGVTGKKSESRRGDLDLYSGDIRRTGLAVDDDARSNTET